MRRFRTPRGVRGGLTMTAVGRVVIWRDGDGEPDPHPYRLFPGDVLSHHTAGSLAILGGSVFDGDVVPVDAGIHQP